MRRHLGVFALLVAAGIVVAACGDDGESNGNGNGDGDGGNGTMTPATDLDPARFQSTVDNRFFPLRPGDMLVYEGEETDPDTGEVIALRVESTVLSTTEVVGGIEVTVVEVKDYEDGELAESTLDYYAQLDDGTVYYMGERVDDYEDGEVVGHSGEWLAGEDGNQAGVFMPAGPQVGDEFEQERAPGIAEDESKVIEVDVSVSTAAGEFTGCIRTEDYDPLGDVTEFKYYCPDVGLVREESEDGDSMIELISF